MSSLKLKTYTPLAFHKVSHRVTCLFLRLFFKATMRFEVRGLENVPRSGPVIVVSNHLNNLDPIIILVDFPRWVNWIGKESLFTRFVLKDIMYWAHVIPIQRNGAVSGKRDALRRSRQVLEAGCILGIFPEGMRSTSHTLMSAQPGAMFIAIENRAPMLPVAIAGTEKLRGGGWLLRRPAITLTVGKPFTLPVAEGLTTRDQIAAIGDLTMAKIAELLPPEYRGPSGEGTHAD